MPVTFNEVVQSDNIDTLPVDKLPLTESETYIADTLFKNHNNIKIFMTGAKDVIMVGLLYILFCLPNVEEYVRKLVPSTGTSVYIMVFVKALLFMLLYFVLQNLHLVRK